MTDSAETIPCSNCKRDILSANFVIHDIHCQRNIYLCSKCNEPVNHKQKAEHDEANHVSVYCTNCHIQIEKYLLNDHLSNDCPHRKLKCQICDIEIGASDISEHENYCGSRTEQCVECGEYIMLKYKQLHIDSNHTFIKLSDEPGPNPSWHKGKQTLASFFPDLDLVKQESHSQQKKKSGRSDYAGRRARGFQKVVERDDRTSKDSTSFDGKQRSNDSPKKIDRSLSDHKDLKGAVSRADYKTKVQNSKELRSDVAELYNPDCGCDKVVRKEARSKKEKKNDGSVSRKTKEAAKNKISTEFNYRDDEDNLGLNIKFSDELIADFQKNSEKRIAQHIDESTAILSEFSLFDPVEKDKNVYSEKKPDKTVSKPQLKYNPDDCDDEFLLYSKESENDLDCTDLPCQFCGLLYPSYAFMSHQRTCDYFENFDLLPTRKLNKKKSGNNEKETLIPCTTCLQLIPFSRYSSHQNIFHSMSARN